MTEIQRMRQFFDEIYKNVDSTSANIVKHNISLDEHDSITIYMFITDFELWKLSGYPNLNEFLYEPVKGYAKQVKDYKNLFKRFKPQMQFIKH